MRCKTILLTFLAITILDIPSICGQELSTNKTALTNRLTGFEKEIEQLTDRWNLPGLAVGIVTDSSVVWAKGFGVRNIKTNAPVTKNTLFGIGSATKAFTAASLGILKDDGKMEWNTPIREYLPNFRMHDEFATREITAIDLLTHRSGLPRHDLIWYSTNYSREPLVHRLRYLKPVASFRAEYRYSNLMYMTAGYLAGQVSGSTWENLTQERILKPLEMSRTTFSTSKMQDIGNYARPYKGTPDTTMNARLFEFNAAEPAGAINASVSDMNTWLQLFLNEGFYNGEQIIDTTTIAELTQPRIFTGYPPSFVEDYGSASFYGLGWNVITHMGNRLLLHAGNIDGYLSLVGMLPDREVGWVILSNKDSSPNPVHSIIMFDLINRVLDKEYPNWNRKISNLIEQAQGNNNSSQGSTSNNSQDTPRPSHPLEDYTGTYTHPAYGTFEVTIDDKQLVAHYGTIQSSLSHKKYDLFQFPYMMVGNKKMMDTQFKMDMEGNIDEVAVKMELPEPIVFTRKE